MTKLAKFAAVAGMCLAAAMTPSVTLAQPGPSYDLSWWNISNGGGTISGGVYKLTATIGQPDGNAVSEGGNFRLTGGFLHGSRLTSGLRDWALY